MSEPLPTDNPQTPPAAGPGGCLIALMFLAGVLMLLPGLCSLIFMGMAVTDIVQRGFSFDSNAQSIIGLWVVTFVIAGVGILLIRAASRAGRR
jgi:hypothetical protein